MLPAYIDASTISSAERRIFELLKSDPATSDWVVLHSLGLANRGSKPYGEIDFVVLIPRGGIFCLEVKGGRIACKDGKWETTNRHGKTERIKRSPFIQAREGMFALRNSVLQRAPSGFPNDLLYGYAVVMPDVSFAQKSPEWHSWQIIDRDVLKQPISVALLRLVSEQRKFHSSASVKEPVGDTIQILQQLLRPDFEFVMTRGAQIEETEMRLLNLTDEQFAVLDLLVDNERCLFEGAAGTGKTMLALEYARRSALMGKKTLLVCYNRLLGEWLEEQISETEYAKNLHVGSYYKLLRSFIMKSSVAKQFVEKEKQDKTAEFYEQVYPSFGQIAIKELENSYDVLVVDEAQDLLKPKILNIFDLWLKGGLASGCWAIFADFHRQAIFGGIKGDTLKKNLETFCSQYAKGRLNLNCRNTRNIGEETALLSGFNSPPYRIGQIVGPAIDYRYYISTGSLDVAKIISELLSDGVKPSDIILLSRFRFENSGVFNVDGGNNFKIVDTEGDVPASSVPAIRFFTIQAFKGMESPVVILCDVDQVSDEEPQCLLYVAMSRARSQLTMLVHEQVKPLISDCVRRKLQDGWKEHL